MLSDIIADNEKDTVVLLHGISDHSLHMTGAALAMRKAGYRTVNIAYPSRQRDLAGLADYLDQTLGRRKVWDKGGKVHFLTHSMGGLVTHTYLNACKARIPAERMGRVVMTAPPHRGSEMADFLKDFGPYRWFYGPAGQQLVTSRDAADDIWYELGIIAGNRPWPLVTSLVMPGEHDGLVSVASTRLPGMKDHVVVPAAHSFIHWHSGVHRHAVSFFRTGAFDRA